MSLILQTKSFQKENIKKYQNWGRISGDPGFPVAGGGHQEDPTGKARDPPLRIVG